MTSIVTQTLVHRDEHALCAENFVWYPGATIALQATLLVLHVSIAAVSGSGAVFDKTTRRSLPALCYVRTGNINYIITRMVTILVHRRLMFSLKQANHNLYQWCLNDFYSDE